MKRTIYFVLNTLLYVVVCTCMTAIESTVNCAKDEYYSGISYLLQGQQPTNQAEWEDLISQLYTLLKSTHVVIPYTATGTDVWDALGVLDADPGDPTKVMLTYSGISVDWSTNGLTTGWNREHVWPRSYGLFDNGPDYSDLHNLRPADANVNSARNNLYYDDCYPSDDASCTQPAHAEAAADTAKNSYKFMPSAAEKGDLARAAFYDALRYNGTIGSLPESSTEQLTLSACACVGLQRFGNLTTLLRWHSEDAVTESEMKRNNQTCDLYQKNRNPFVDFPWLSAMFTQPQGLSSVVSSCPDNYVDPDSSSCESVDPESPTASPTVSIAPTPDPIACALSAGDVAIVSFNSDAPDSLTAVALTNIPSGTQLFFTDKPWNGNEFPSSGEGVLLFLTTTVVPAGSQWFYPDGGESWGSWSEVAGSFNLATSGDQILAFCGAMLSPTFLYGVTNNGWLSEGESVSSTTSVLPEALAQANASATLPAIDNMYYDGTTVGTQTELLEQISKGSNWKGSNTVAVPISIADFFVVYEETVSPTARPSRTPTRGPTTAAATETSMQFTVDIVIDNAESSAADDSASESALRLTLQDAMPEVPLSDISVLSMRETSSRLPSGLSSVSSFSVQYAVDVVLEDLGYSAWQCEDVYSEWVAAVEASVSSGQFSDDLSENADSTGAAPLAGATVSTSQEVVFSNYTLSSVSTAQEGSTHNVTVGTRIGYMVFIFSMGFAGVYIVWSFIHGRKTFLEKYPPRVLERKKKTVSGSSDDYEVTVKRTTFSKKGPHDAGCLAHVSNPMRRVQEEDNMVGDSGL